MSELIERRRVISVLDEAASEITRLQEALAAAETERDETRKKALEEAAQIADMMGIDSRTEATSRAADGDYSAANHFNAHGLGCEQVAAAIRALAEEVR